MLLYLQGRLLSLRPAAESFRTTCGLRLPLRTTSIGGDRWIRHLSKRDRPVPCQIAITPEMAASHPCQTPTFLSARGASLVLLSLAFPLHPPSMPSLESGCQQDVRERLACPQQGPRASRGSCPGPWTVARPPGNLHQASPTSPGPPAPRRSWT